MSLLFVDILEMGTVVDEFESEFKLVREHLKQMKESFEKFRRLNHTKGRTHKDTISKFIAAHIFITLIYLIFLTIKTCSISQHVVTKYELLQLKASIGEGIHTLKA